MEGKEVTGPMHWDEIVKMANERKISTKAMVKQEHWPDWVSVGYYFPPTVLVDKEIAGLIPSKFDAIFYGGMGLFFVGFITLLFNLIAGLVLLGLSAFLEIFAIYLDRKKKLRGTTSKVGNVFAIIWIVTQIAITVFMPFLII